jgi:hypothetical protein
MTLPWTMFAAVAAGLAALLRFVPRVPALRRLADVLLLLAMAAALAAVAFASAWHPEALAHAAASGPPRPPVQALVACGLVSFAALLSLGSLAAMWPRRSGEAVRIGLAGTLAALAVVSVAQFAKLEHGPTLTSLAVASLAAGASLWLLLRRPEAAGARTRALFVAAVAVTAGAATLALSGAAASRVAFSEGESQALLGQQVTYRGSRAAARDARALDVVIASGPRQQALHPVLRSTATGRLEGRAAAAPFSGPVVTPLALRELPASPHALRWLAKGDSLSVGGVVVRFERFRMDMGHGMRVYADLDVEHAGIHATFSPGMMATAEGEESFAVTIPGVGPVSVGKIDADHGRVGLVVPGAAPEPARTQVLLDVRLRPMLPLAWAAAALALLAFLASLRGGRREEARPV